MTPRWIATPEIPPDAGGPTHPYAEFTPDRLARPIPELLAEAARQHPTRPVLEDGSGPLSFEALLARIAAIAIPDGAGPLGLLLPPGRDAVAATFATLAAGRIALLLDPTHPRARTDAILERTGTTQLLNTLAQGPAGVRNPLGPDAPAVILCTSGSTGAPKAMAHSQRTMLHWARSITNALHVTPGDRVLSLSSMASLGGFTALLAFPLAGASLQLLDVATAGFGALVETLRTRPVSVLRASPSLLRRLVTLPDLGATLHGLRIVQTYGEPLLQADLAALRLHLAPHCLVRSTYGSTEASGLAWFARTPESHDPVRVANGTLMPDTQARILDEHGQDCPPGEPGQLAIRSRYNALGEWRDGHLAPGSLIQDPDDPDARIFHTGDLARCTPDGVFVVLGRQDRMVNINGQRAEPAELEAALRRNPHVAAAAALIDATGPRTLLRAYIVPHPAAPPDLPARLRTELRTLVPAYLQPTSITPVATLPLLPSGKIDERALLSSPLPLREGPGEG